MKRLLLTLGLLLASAPAFAASTWILVNPVTQAAPATAPTLGGAGNTVTWTQGGSNTVLDSSLTVSGTITGASVTVTSGFVFGDTLAFTNTGTITGTYNAAAGQLTLSGADSAANYQTALRTITYSSPVASPTSSGASTSRTVTWSGINVASSSAGVATTVNVVELPTLAGEASNVSYTQGGPAAVLSPSITVSDFSAANLTGGTVSITSTFLAGDTLSFTNQLGITGSYNAGTGVLTLSGTTTLANYQTAMQTITYSFTGADVTNGGTNLTRTALWSITDSNSNSVVPGSETELFTVTAGGSTAMPSWVPSWAATGSVSCNYTVGGANGQCWNGTTVVAATTYLTTTRASNESCETTNALTTATSNVPCINTNGLGAWPAATNLVWPSHDFTVTGNWVTFTQGGTISVVPNSVTGPDNASNTATQVTVVSNVSGQTEFLGNNGITIPATGQYTISCWLKADSSTMVGKRITIGAYDGANPAPNTLVNVTLTANWVRYSGTVTQNSGTGLTPGTQLYVGVTSNSGIVQPLYPATIVFDVYGCQEEAGATLTPTIKTTSGPVTRPIDNIQVTGAFSALLAGTTGTYLIQTNDGQLGAATVLASNGNIFAGESSTNGLTTSLPALAGPTTTANWFNITTAAEAWSPAGKTMALNGSVYYTDAAAPVPAAPFYLGANIGAASPQAFGGYIQLATAAPTRVPNTTIGLAPGGTNYFFAAAGSDTSNTCTNSASPCQTLAKANSLSYNSSDTLNFNKGDTFTGCLALNGNGGNVQSISGSPLTVQSYGTGGVRPLLTSQGVQCAPAIGRPGVTGSAATVHLNGITGLVWNGVNVECDTTGINTRGISIENAAPYNSNSITIENVTSTQGCYFNATSPTNNQQGALISWDGSDGSTASHGTNTHGTLMYGVTIMNIVCSGPTPTSQTSAQNCLDTGGTQGNQINFALIQGILAYNLGGFIYTPSNAASNGTGVLLAGLGDAAGSQQIVQYVVAHDVAANQGACGNNYGLWMFISHNVTVQFSESYHVRNATAGACDLGGFDFDNGTQSSILQYNYAHDNSGAGIAVYMGALQGINWGNNVFRYNITDSNGVNQSNEFTWSFNTNPSLPAYVYNNTFASTGSPGNNSNGDAGHAVTYLPNSCPGPGSLWANNLEIGGQVGGNRAIFNYLFSACANMTFSHNGYWCPACSGQSQYLSYFSNTSRSMNGSPSPWQTSGVPGGDTGIVIAQNPLFAGAVRQNVTCYGGTTAPLTNPLGSCPSAYVLGGGSPYKSPAGADLTTSGFGSLNVGTQDYYGVAIPCGGGYPIGASC